jgi:hypothetical protein
MPDRRSVFSVVRPLPLAAAILAVVLLGPRGIPQPGVSAQVIDPCAGTTVNPIACENSKPGNPASEWDVSGAGSAFIQGFATEMSVNRGETVRFKIDTNATSYRLDIYRLGYYGGLGARYIATVAPSAPLPQAQPNCLSDSSTGLVDCGNWAQSASWAVPSTAVSGIYLAKLVRTDSTAGSSHIVFVVRDDSGGSDILFQTSDTTWQAYNTYGGNSLYVGSPAGRAYMVSYNRPFTTRQNAPEDWLFNAEYPMVRWLEANGYNVSYSSGIDTDRRGAELLEHRVFLSVGHDEYWSGDQRANVEAARDLGVHLGFFSGNEVFWKVRWAPSIDGSGTPYRTLVSYKETHANAKIDPTGEWTGTWRDPRFSPPSDGGRPENALTGTIFTVNCCTYAITVPEPFGKMRLWRNTSIATLAPGQTASLPLGTLGYEWDEDLDNGFRPAGLFRLSETTVSGVDYIQDYGTNYGSGTATHSLTMYTAPSGAKVFGAGTVQWSWGLDSTHDRGNAAPDVRMRQATVNLLADMGVQPSTLQSGLTAATASTDTTAPTTVITGPAAGATIAQGTPVTIQGTASDVGGIVAAVEVSVDGGTTWRRATGRSTWTFAWVATGSGPRVIRSRGVDDSGNIESPGASVSVTLGSTQTGTGPVAAYAFNEGTGTTAADASGTGNTGTLSGATWTTAGKNGGAASFNGSSAMITVPDSTSLRLTSGMTMSAWVRPTTLSGWRTVLLKERTNGLSYGLYAHDGSRPAAYINTGGADRDATGGAALPANTWTHVAATYDGATLRLFINATQAASQSGSGNLISSTGALRIGGNQVWGEYFSGQIDDVRIYARALSAAEIASDMNTPVGSGSAPPPADTTPPTVVSVVPASGAAGVSVGATATATFSEAMNAASIDANAFQLRDASNQLVAASVTYDTSTLTATLDPAANLEPGATYTATVRGGATDPRVKDAAGNALAATVTWSFTTAAVPPSAGPGGPILVIANAANPFSRYYAEILLAEGLNYFTVTDLSQVTAASLAGFDVAILAETTLTSAQVSMLTTWVNGGGNLIAMRPDKQLAGLLGLTDQGTTLSDRYLLIQSTGPGAGLVHQTIQYHGTADRYSLGTATGLATLYSSASVATTSPAVSLRAVGSNGGQAAAFAFDLARSVVYTRQGNPAWAGDERDGVAPIRSNDMFYGAKSGDLQPDWVDLTKAAIPQADEQQRLLANLILQMAADRKPLPRFWYLPRGLKAAVLMTGDDHGLNGTAGRWDSYLSASPANCSVEDWECVRGTSYIFPTTPLSNSAAAAYAAAGFEVGLHVNTGCADYTPSSFVSTLTSQLAAWSDKYVSLPAPRTNRTHCIAFSDWASQPKALLASGIRLDTNYYFWPGTWVQNRPGFMTGSGMPMRFADLDGTTIDVYQAATQLTDESDQTFPFTIDTLLDRALGAEGYYGVFTANMHTDTASHAGSDAIVSSALARNVPIVSALQMLTWLDGRNASSFSNLQWAGSTLSFTLVQGPGARGLQAMVPAQSAAGAISSITRGGSPVAYTTQTIKGVSYATFAAVAGAHTVVYGTAAAPETAITSSPAVTTTSTSASFAFTATPSSGSTFECALDGGAFASCTSPRGYSGLAVGSHTFRVRAVNGGITDPTPASFTWTIEAVVPPDTTITSSPAASTTSTSASFSFTATPSTGATFECALDGAAFSACTSPRAYAGLAVGGHTFQVRAVNSNGTDPTPASFSWTITLPSPPETTITSAPAASTTSTSASFSFTATPSTGATFECALDGAGFSACTSPRAYSGLALGGHTFQVRAVNTGGADPTPASFSWTITLPAPPETTITSAPQASTTSTSASFSFTANPSAGATFECALDGAAFGACTSPQAYAGLALGGHTFQVRAVGAGGPDPSPASFTWTITSAPPPSANLVAAYGFEEASGTTVVDESGSGNTGTLTNATRTASGRFGRALSFNGTSALVTVADSASLDLTNAMTFSAWVNPSSLSDWRTILLKEAPSGLAYGLYASNGSRPDAYIRVGNADIGQAGTAALPTNTWTHVAATYDGSTLRLYINGTQVATRAISGSVAATSGALRIGGNLFWGEYFAGLIDEVRIYSRVLSGAEIASDMNTAIRP